jgi:hypothetical protein
MNNRFKFRVWDLVSKKYDPYIYNIGEQFGHPSCVDWIVHQYTGYKDVDNQEIYEGDILKNLTPHKYSPDIFVVQWSEFEPSDDMGVGGIGFVLPWFHCQFRPKIIGNIFEPPCNFDHNGECLICDCWPIDCIFKKYE